MCKRNVKVGVCQHQNDTFVSRRHVLESLPAKCLSVAEALPRGLHGEAAVREVGRSRGVFPRIPEGDVAETFAQGIIN